jgi:hypothetical protein
MALIDVSPQALLPFAVALNANQSGTGDTTNILDLGPHFKANSIELLFFQSVGATPTCTYLPNVSADNSSYSAATFADVSTPGTTGTTAFTVTAGGLAATKIVYGKPTDFRYLKVVLSANTNVNSWIYALIRPQQRWV